LKFKILYKNCFRPERSTARSTGALCRPDRSTRRSTDPLGQGCECMCTLSVDRLVDR